MKGGGTAEQGVIGSKGLAGDIGSDILAMQGAQIFVVGDLILDTYVEGVVGRISPEAPVPVVHVQRRRDVLGGAGNVAANVCALGGEAILCGRLGQDSAGSRFADIAAEQGIVGSALLWSEHLPTTRKTRVLAGSQHIVRLDDESLVPVQTELEKQALLHFERFCEASAGRPRALVVSDYDKGMLTSPLIAKLIGKAAALGVPVIVDPKKRDVSIYSGCTVIKPNLAEAGAILRGDVGGAALKSDVSLLAKIRGSCGARNVVVSLSADGVVCEGEDVSGGPRHYPSRALKVADVSGAGDTMVSLLALGLASGLSLERATMLGNVAAGLVCALPGTATLTASDLIRGYQADGAAQTREKIVDLATASRLAERLRSEGHRLVFTNGCFDLLHPGHVETLHGAKQKGDFLFVGLNSDASIRRLKGKDRPIQDQVSRATVLASLACVDFVIVFDTDTPIDLIRSLRPECLVKGGDYKVLEDIVGAKDVLGWGGRVETIPLVAGQSTTRMIERSGGGGKSS